MTTSIEADAVTTPTARGAIAVTGGAKGIGRQVAITMASAGHPVWVGDRDQPAIDELTAEAAAAGLPITGHQLELGKPDSIREFVEAAASGGHGLAGLVCSGGISPTTPVLELTLEQWHLVQDINLTGTFIAAQEAARHMVSQGSGGSIVTVSSTIGVSGGRPGFAAYAASKGAVISLTKTMAIELGPHQVRVNCVAPGAVDTPLFRATVGDTAAKTWSKSPLGRVGEPEDLANAIEFLLGDRSTWITGQVLHVNGGVYM